MQLIDKMPNVTSHGDGEPRTSFSNDDQNTCVGFRGRYLHMFVLHVTFFLLFLIISFREYLVGSAQPLFPRVADVYLSSWLQAKPTSENITTRSCFSETDRILVCICSYGNSGRSGNLDDIFHALIHLNSISGARIEFVLYYSDFQRPYRFGETVPSGVEFVHKWVDENLGHHFSGSCRQDFNHSLDRAAHTHYLYVEDDINVTVQNLEYLCEEFNFLNRAGVTDYRPGLLRYENFNPTNRVLTDNSLCCPPQIDAVVDILGRKYIQPTNPYEALYFLPSGDFRRILQRQFSKEGTTYTSSMQTAQGLVREHHAGLWMTGLVTKIVSVPRFEDALVHHSSDNYVGAIELPPVELYLKHAELYNGRPVSLHTNATIRGAV